MALPALPPLRSPVSRPPREAGVRVSADDGRARRAVEWARRALPLPAFSRYPRHALGKDATAAIAVAFMGVPQGLAYATIAHLPPAMGLYASALPGVLGALFRSSRHVIPGPTNALSLLVGAGLAAGIAPDPLTGAVTLAFLVGVLQVAAGVLRLGALVDYISQSVVLGYITGAGVLIGIGQLYNFTGTHGDRGRIWVTVGGWLTELAHTQPIALAMAGGTVVAILLVRRYAKKLPASVVVTAAAIGLNLALDLEGKGLKVIHDISPIPAGLPPLTLPDLSLALELMPLAVACTVLSLLESNAVARSIAQKTGDRLDASTEFSGQGFANLTAAFTGGYPISGSLSRSALNQRAGAETRASGVFAAALMLIALLLFGPVLDHTPVAALAGILVVVAWDLVDVPRIKKTWGAGWADRTALAATLLGTWALDLDAAIYLGVTVSIVLFLRKARLVTIREVRVSSEGAILEEGVGDNAALFAARGCPRVRILQLTGSLFFGAANELTFALDEMMATPGLDTLIVRLRRTQGMDATVAGVFAAAAVRMRDNGQRLVLVGVADATRAVLDGAGATADIGAHNIRPMGVQLLDSLRAVVAEASSTTCERCADGRCPLTDLPRSTPRAAA